MTKNNTNDDGNTASNVNYDGFIMRLTPLGFVQWVSYLSAKMGYDEYVGNIVQFITGAGTAIMGVFHTLNTPTTARVNAIVKLTYDEGKLIWAKQIVYADFIFTPPLTVTKHSAWMIDSDPTFMSRMITSTVLNIAGKGQFPAITSLKDDGTTLLVDTNYFFIPQQNQLSYIPGISNIAWSTTTLPNPPTSAFFAIVHYHDSVNNFPSLLIGAITIASGGSLTWATMIPGSSTMSYESTTQPHVLQRNSKLYVTTVVNTNTAGQYGNVFIT